MRLFFILLMLCCSTPANAHAEFSFSARDINGNMINTEDYKDKIIMLNFWATWCSPCIMEMPHLQNIKNKYSISHLLVGSDP